MLASLVLEQEPLHWLNFPAALETWVRIMGGFSAVALVIFLIVSWFRAPLRRTSKVPWLSFLFGAPDAVKSYYRDVRATSVKWPAWQAILFRWLVLGMFGAYILWSALMAPLAISAAIGAIEGESRLSPPWGTPLLRGYALDFGAACAVLAVALPLLADLLQIHWSWRRIWALTRLSFKEAVRRRVLWVFSAFLLIVLFASWFMPYKPEDQVRNYVSVVYFASAVLMLLAAGLLAAFSLPADMKNQTIHTIVTKPVQRFEIVAGRFLGYVLLLSLVLAVITGIGLLYMVREIDSDAQVESMRARVPVYGELVFRGKEGTSAAGMNVGREWGYRSYIMGGPTSSHRAIWSFFELPGELGNRKSASFVPCEFSLDIFRTVKGEEGKGVFCSFVFQTHRWDPRQESEYRKAREQANKLMQVADRRALIEQATKEIRGNAPTEEETKEFVEDRSATAPGKLLDQLFAEKYGIFEVSNKEIVDYHTQSVDVPGTLFKNALASAPHQPSAALLRHGEERTPLLSVSVKCESGGQYVGAAKHDFYILAAEGSFAWNFFKGAIGLWMRLCVVLGVAITCSTYLSGVIAWLTTMFLYVAGCFQDYIRMIASGLNPEGGPISAVMSLVSKQGVNRPMDVTPGAHIAQGTDFVFRVIFRLFLYLFPDVNRLDWTEYVAEGFNIGGFDIILLHLLLLVGYLTPCALIAYYLMKSREVAA